MSYANMGSMAATVVVSRDPDRSGNYICDGTADDVQVQAALDYIDGLSGNYTGKVIMKRGNYNFNTTVTLPLYSCLVGESRHGVYITADSAAQVFVLPESASVVHYVTELGNIHIILPSAAGQEDAIASSATSDEYTAPIWIHDISFEGGNDATNYCINITNPVSNQGLIENIRFKDIKTSGLRLYQDHTTFNSGNMLIRNITGSWGSSFANCVGIHLEAINESLAQNKFDYVKLYGTSNTGSTALLLETIAGGSNPRIRFNEFYATHAEGWAKCIHLNALAGSDIWRNWFEGRYLFPINSGGNFGIDIDAPSSLNTFKDMYIDGASTTSVDESNDTMINYFMNIEMAGTKNLSSASRETGVRLAGFTTGQYTGDGAVSQAITGVGFRPKYVLIVQDVAADQGVEFHWVTDQHSAGFSSCSYAGAPARTEDNHIISLDDDGFTVDDDGADAHPNKNGVTYNYVARS